MPTIPFPMERPMESKDSVPLMLADTENKKKNFKKSEFLIIEMHI